MADGRWPLNGVGVAAGTFLLFLFSFRDFFNGVFVRFSQEAAEKKPPTNQCTYVLYLARIGLLYTYDDVIFLIAFLSSPYRETPKNALKTNR
jgi:hypothetical protein